MSVIPCKQNVDLREKIEKFAEDLKKEAHHIGDHGLDEEGVHRSGLFRGAIERLRGQYSATMKEKREFAQQILDHMRDGGFIKEWKSTGGKNRHDYSIELNSGKTAALELKGCLDGNNTNIFERPAHAHEFVIWSICTNPGADPRYNAWSGIHTRLSTEIIFRSQRVDGLIIWDMVCGTVGRPCPKVEKNLKRVVSVGRFKLPPPCIYVFPSTIPSPRNNPNPPAQRLEEVGLLSAFHACFKGQDEEVNYVDFKVSHKNEDTMRKTRIVRDGATQRESNETSIRRA